MSNKVKGQQKNPLIVAIGASAGGLNCYQRFFKNMPADGGMVFVLVHHLDPNHKSLMAEILSRYTDMPVSAIADHTPIEADHVYVIPPNATLTVEDGHFKVKKPYEPHGQRMPIDNFFISLAKHKKDNVVGIVMSGSGADGTLGLKAIKENGGIVFVQTPETAQYDSMPSSAMLTGLVDFVLDIEDMPAKILEYKEHLEILKKDRDELGLQKFDEQSYRKLLDHLKQKSGHDFRDYKRNTMIRRVQRRMQVLQVTSLEEYLDYIGKHEDEANLLFNDLLIGVTFFFRDKKSFDELSKTVIPEIYKKKKHLYGNEQIIRVWVVGCSTGEEAYSLAILFKEYAQKKKEHYRIQIFATDIDSQALEFARRGKFSEVIEKQIDKDILRKYFIKKDGQFEIHKELKDMILFSPHNVIMHPPFSRIDLISSRNLFIYLNNELQKKITSIFHYALKKGGYLFLGPSENIIEPSEYFKPVNKTHRIYKANPAVQKKLPDFTYEFAYHSETQQKHDWSHDNEKGKIINAFENILLNELVFPSLLINQKGDIKYMAGDLKSYLDPQAGSPDMNVFHMLSPDLKMEIRPLLHAVVSQRTSKTREMIRGEGEKATFLEILARPYDDHDLFIFSFKSYPVQTGRQASISCTGQDTGKDDMIMALENELKKTKEDLQMTIEELETSNEELKSSNEELMSMNEELQSSNEEINSSKEELQSMNEELQMVNAELTNKIEALDDLNSDMRNLYESTQIATIFLDNDLNIRDFTPMAAEMFRIIRTDMGRPITDFTPRFTDVNMREECEIVLQNLTKRSLTVSHEKDKFFTMQITPYRRYTNVINGVTISFFDITNQHHLNDELQRRIQEMETIFRLVPVGVAMSYDKECQDIRVNPAGAKILGIADKINASLTGGGPGYKVRYNGKYVPASDLPMQKAVREGKEIVMSGHQIVRPDGSVVDLQQSALPLRDAQGHIIGAVSAFTDVTRLKAAEKVLNRNKKTLEKKIKEKSKELEKAHEFLHHSQRLADVGTLSAQIAHELRNPLAAIGMAAYNLEKNIHDKNMLTKIDCIKYKINESNKIIDNLLFFSRLRPPEYAMIKPYDLLHKYLAELQGVQTSGIKIIAKELESIKDLEIEADGHQFKEVFLNILNNACDAVDQKSGKIIIIPEVTDHSLAIGVKDNGEGIPNSYINQVRDPFFTTKSKGTGLGLTICQEIMNMHNGELLIKSQKGLGTTVTCTFPLTKDHHEKTYTYSGR